MKNKFNIYLLLLVIIIFTFGVTALLIDVFEKKQEGKLTYLKVVEIPEGETNPEVWRQNFPREYDSHIKTMRTSEFIKYSKFGRYGGSENFSKLDLYPNILQLFAGYPFSVEYNEERGHMNALSDMLSSKRLGDKKPGSCMSCKSDQVPGFIQKNGAAAFYSTPVKELVDKHNFKYSIACADCHDSKTMNLKITRPAFLEAMQRRGIDVSSASRQQMRTFVCAQCHVEYYFKGVGKYLTFPWDNGLIVDSIETYYDKINFSDWKHKNSKTNLIKMQHPEFELWSSGIHARAQVSCADCHMPYKREGSVKITDHWIKTPLATITNSCLTCHRQTEEEMKQRVFEIQDKTFELLNRAEEAIIASIKQIEKAAAIDSTHFNVLEAQKLHRKAQLRWDFISAENSMGFHSPQEAARILADAIDFARQAELVAFKGYQKLKNNF